MCYCHNVVITSISIVMLNSFEFINFVNRAALRCLLFGQLEFYLINYHPLPVTTISGILAIINIATITYCKGGAIIFIRSQTKRLN